MPQGDGRPERTRHIVTYPEEGQVVLMYGCSECCWRYVPAKAEDVQQQFGTLWYATTMYENHNCSKFGVTDPRQDHKNSP